MRELELTRTPGDRRLYTLAGIGTLRLEGLFSRSATAEAGGESWRFNHRGFWQRVMQATDVSGAVVGEFVPRDIRRGGVLRFAAFVVHQLAVDASAAAGASTAAVSSG